MPRLLRSTALPGMSEIRREQARIARGGFLSCSQSLSGPASASWGKRATIAPYRIGTSVNSCRTQNRVSLPSIGASDYQRRQDQTAIASALEHARRDHLNGEHVEG